MIINKEAFLEEISQRLGRPTPRIVPNILPTTTARQLQGDVIQRAGAKDCVELFMTRLISQGGNAVYIDTRDALVNVLVENRDARGLKRAIIWNDSHIQSVGIPEQLRSIGIEQTMNEMEADLGITFAEWGVAETGTFAVYNRPNKPRSVSLVPNTYIALLSEDSIVPTMNFVLDDMSKVAKVGEMPSCINLIAGPSSSADIELELVIGIHGPTYVTAVILSHELCDQIFQKS